MQLPAYTHILMGVALVLAFLTVLYLLRGRWRSRPAGLQSLFRRNKAVRNELYQELVMPLLIHEERYPAFGKILALVFERFPLEWFLKEQEFHSALKFLNRAVYHQADPRALTTAMGVVVRTFVSDPEVQYRCRSRLEPLVRDFLKEVERGT